MSEIAIRLPDRPLRVRPPALGAGSQLFVIVWAILVLAVLGWEVIRPIGDLLVDRSLVGKAQPVPGAKVQGGCTIHGGVIATCDGTLTVSRPHQPDLSRDVNYFFIDLHGGSYTVRVVADPARPELLSTDLGLDMVTNRIITLVVLGPLFLVIGVVGLVVARRSVGRKRAMLRALSHQVLRPVLLRMDRYAFGQWTVSPLAPGQWPASTWTVPSRARPIVMDPDRRAILGVTAGDGRVSMPLDAALTWIDVTEDERRRIVEQLGDRLGNSLAALDSSELAVERRRLRRAVRGLTIVGLCLAVLGGGAAWGAFREHDTGPGERVELRRGDEAAPADRVRLRGVWQSDRAARITRAGERMAQLETWVPVTAPGWTAGEPVTWLVRDPQHGVGTSGLVTRSGTVLRAELPAEARSDLARHGIALAPALHLLDVPLPPEDPLRLPAIVIAMIGGVLGLSLLLGAAILRARLRRREAMLRG